MPLVLPLTAVVGLTATCTLLHALIEGTGCCLALLHTSKLAVLRTVGGTALARAVLLVDQ